MATVDMSRSYIVRGGCPRCGELVIQATLDSAGRCSRCGLVLYEEDLDPSEHDGRDLREVERT